MLSGSTTSPPSETCTKDSTTCLTSAASFSIGQKTVAIPSEGAAVSAEQLLEKAWDEHTDPFTNAVRMTILKLRRKLGDPPLVLTDPGVGYRIP